MAELRRPGSAATSFFAKAALFAGLAVTALPLACAPEHAAKVRADKSLTLGAFGAAYRPNGKFGFGATVGTGTETKTVDPTKSDGDVVVTKKVDADLYNYRNVKTSATGINPFVHYYPWETSAFFVGAAASIYTAKYSFHEETSGSTSLLPSYTDVDYNQNATYVGVPLGWAWIWESGFSLTLDFGPRTRVAATGHYSKDGTDDGVDVAKRDLTTKAIDKLGTGILFGGPTGNLLVGWSF